MSTFENHRLPLFRILIIIGAAWWIYGPVLQGDWIWDDGFYVRNNPLMHDPARVWKAWFVPGSFAEYYPIEQTVQWLQWRMWGTNTFGYHLTNVALHVTSCLLLWRLLAKLGVRLAWIGGLIFAIHPLMVESVAWISELKNTLALPPLLLAMCAWIDYDAQRRPRDYLLALGLFLTAMLCKVTAVLFPAVILLYAWWKRGRMGLRDVFGALPFALVSWLITHLMFVAAGKFLPAQVGTPELLPIGGTLSRLAVAGLAASFYFGKVWLPVNLMPIYPTWRVEPPTLLDFLPWVVLVLVAVMLGRERKGWGRHAILGLGFFFINLSPFLAVGLVFFPRDSWVMNHLAYMPSIGLVGLAAAGAGDLERKLPGAARGVAIALAAMAALFMAWGSRDYARVHFDQRSLWTYAAEHNAAAYTPHNNLGVLDFNAHELTAAEGEFNEAIQLEPTFPEAHNGLGNVLLATGRVPEAMAQYEAALKAVPRSPQSLNGLANALLQQGRFAEALEPVNKALAISPRYAEAHCTLGLVLANMGRIKDAVDQFEMAHQLQPQDARIEQVLEQLRALPPGAHGK